MQIQKILVGGILQSFFVGATAFAQESITPPTDKRPLSHESELSLVNISGNSASESYSAKQKTVYQIEPDTYSVTGRYLRVKSGGNETARSWDATGRYERSLSPTVSGFASYGAEADPYNGYVQHDNTDVGGKYFFIKSDPRNFFAEGGYRYQVNLDTLGVTHRDSLARIYGEYFEKVDETFSYKLWVEYLPNFSDPQRYYINTEPSLTFVLSTYLSLRAAYTVRYHNLTVNAAEERIDTTWTTSLVARF